MNELTMMLAIVSPLITYFIGRYFRVQSQRNFQNVSQARDYWKDSNNKRWKRIKELEMQVRDLQTTNATLQEQLNNQ